MTSLTDGGEALERSDVYISSLIDTWLLVRDIEIGGERNRGLYVLKSRGMAHSNQIREYKLTPHGIDLVDVYLGQDGVLTGSARLAREAAKTAKPVRIAPAEQNDSAVKWDLRLYVAGQSPRCVTPSTIGRGFARNAWRASTVSRSSIS